jgi:hypothetical protein
MVMTDLSIISAILLAILGKSGADFECRPLFSFFFPRVVLQLEAREFNFLFNVSLYAHAVDIKCSDIFLR